MEACSDFFIAPHFTKLKQSYPNIQIELVHFARDVKISRNKADIAIAVEKPKVLQKLLLNFVTTSCNCMDMQAILMI